MKDLKEFLIALIDLNQANIDFMDGNEAKTPESFYKYKDELAKISEVINEFDFVKEPEWTKLNPMLLTHPAPNEILHVIDCDCAECEEKWKKINKER